MGIGLSYEIRLFVNFWRDLLFRFFIVYLFSLNNCPKSLKTFIMVFTTNRLERLTKNIIVIFLCPNIIVAIYRTYFAFRVISQVAKAIENIINFWIFFIFSFNNWSLLMLCYKLALTLVTKFFIHNAEETFELIILRWWLFLFCDNLPIGFLFFLWCHNYWRIHIFIKILMSELHHFKSRIFQNLLLRIFRFIHKPACSLCLSQYYIFVWGYFLTFMNFIFKDFMVLIFFESLIWRISGSWQLICSIALWRVIFLYFKLIHLNNILRILSFKTFQKIGIFDCLFVA